MSNCALWIDHQHAVLYIFTITGIREEHLRAEPPQHHHQRHPKDIKANAHEHVLNKLFHKINEKLINVEELLIVGPGTVKSLYKHHCEDRGHTKITDAIVGVESMDSHPSLSQILEKAKSFFKSYHLWTKNYL